MPRAAHASRYCRTMPAAQQTKRNVACHDFGSGASGEDDVGEQDSQREHATRIGMTGPAILSLT
jgi:hypothetical protein